MDQIGVYVGVIKIFGRIQQYKMEQQGFQDINPYAQMTTDKPFPNSLPVTEDIRRSFLADEGYAAQLNPLLAKKSSNHVRSLFANFLLLSGLTVVLALFFTGVMLVSAGALAGICVGIYLFYLILGLCCNPLLSYLGNIKHGSNFQSEYENVRKIQGHFSFYAECYHYETRYHTRTVTDNNGNTRTQTYTTQQKVVTHTATEVLYPRECVDDSGHVDQIRASTEIVFIHNKVNYRFKDDYSRNRFQSQWISFQNRHRRDVHQNYTQNFILPGLQARVCFYVGKDPKNYYGLFIFWSIIGMIWPYSMYVENKVCRYDIQYMKVLSL